MQRTILLASADTDLGAHHARHICADGHDVHTADSATTLTARLAARAVDIVVLADLQAPAISLTVLRRLRAGQLHLRVHPGQPVVTLGAPDTLSTLHAYQAGSDHHFDTSADYLILRAVITAVTRRTIDTLTSRHLHAGALHIDIAARTADFDGQPITLPKTEFELLRTLVEQPDRVFTKHELLRAVYASKPASLRTLDSHASRLRQRLRAAGVPGAVQNVWGIGYRSGLGA